MDVGGTEGLQRRARVDRGVAVDRGEGQQVTENAEKAADTDNHGDDADD